MGKKAKKKVVKKAAKKVPKSERIGLYLQMYPDAATATIVKALKVHGVTPGDVHSYRSRHGRATSAIPELSAEKPAARKPAKKPARPLVRKKPVSVRFDIPSCGLELKLAGRRGQMICTLVVTETGVVVVKPNAKKSGGEIPWSKLMALVDSGLLT